MSKASTRGWIVARFGNELFCQDAHEHSCHNARLVTSTKAFQPNKLRLATNAINAILDMVRDDEHALVLLETSLDDGQGGHEFLLAYADKLAPHIPPKNQVTYNSTEQEIRDGLGLPNAAAVSQS